MKNRFFRGAAFVVVLFGLSQQASAAVLYDNGPINGTNDAWKISADGAVSDSFTLSQDSVVTGASFGVWTTNNTVLSVSWGDRDHAGTLSH